MDLFGLLDIALSRQDRPPHWSHDELELRGAPFLVARLAEISIII